MHNFFFGRLSEFNQPSQDSDNLSVKTTSYIDTAPQAEIKPFNPIPPQSLDVKWWKNHIGDDRYNAFVEWRNEMAAYFPGNLYGPSLLWDPEHEVNIGESFIDFMWKPMKKRQNDFYNEKYKDFIAQLKTGKLPSYVGDESVDFFKDYFVQKYGPELASIPDWDSLKVNRETLRNYQVGNYIGQVLPDLEKEMVVPQIIIDTIKIKGQVPESLVEMISADQFESHWSWSDLSSKILEKMLAVTLDGKKYYIPNHMINWNENELREFRDFKTIKKHEEKIKVVETEKKVAKAKKILPWLAAGAAALTLFGAG